MSNLRPISQALPLKLAYKSDFKSESKYLDRTGLTLQRTILLPKLGLSYAEKSFYTVLRYAENSGKGDT